MIEMRNGEGDDMDPEEWIRQLFINRGGLFLEIMNARWPLAERNLEGLQSILGENGVKEGRILDLCCGNGRYASLLASKGYRVVGVDISPVYIEDARRRAAELGVSTETSFLVGDVRKLSDLIEGPFDAVLNMWTSIGYYDRQTDLDIFRQAAQATREKGVLVVGELAHREFFSLRFLPRSYEELGEMVMLEDRDFDWFDSTMTTKWTFYRREEEDLRFIDRLTYNIKIYGLSELSELLREAGWRPVKAYGSLAPLQPFERTRSWGKLNVVATREQDPLRR